MNRLINAVQIIHDQQNNPAFVVLPIDQYQMLIDADSRHGIPADVAEHAILNHLSAVKAWRMYLSLTQEEVAKRMGITQASYCRLENQTKIRQSSRIKVAKALHIDESQLDF